MWLPELIKTFLPEKRVKPVQLFELEMDALTFAKRVEMGTQFRAHSRKRDTEVPLYGVFLP